jgi:hypothetical protein
MKMAKLGVCLAAASITLAGSAFLSTPAAATTTLAPCSSSELAYANGYADGYCAGKGYSDGTISSCTSNGDGTITISGTCS